MANFDFTCVNTIHKGAISHAPQVSLSVLNDLDIEHIYAVMIVIRIAMVVFGIGQSVTSHDPYVFI